MILVIGQGADPVLGRVTDLLSEMGSDFASLDESRTDVSITTAALPSGRLGWRISGGGLLGIRPVNAVFIRRGPAPAKRHARGLLVPSTVDAMLLSTTCTVVNRPSSTTTNYSKAFQLLQLAAAGFTVPETLVTSSQPAAVEFIERHKANLVLKGLSSVKTTPQVVQQRHLAGLKSLARCPAQFQELVQGIDWRLTVIGRTVFASETQGTTLVSVVNAVEIFVRSLVDRCVEFTRTQGLVVSGIDLRLAPDGEAVVFEMNPFPLITHYERQEDPVISRELCRLLGGHRHAGTDLMA